MTIENIALFKGIDAKMDYLNQRQKVIAQNIANGDTPGYKPKDLIQPDFSKVLKSVEAGKAGVRSLPPVGIASTSGNHVTLGGRGRDGYGNAKEVRSSYEVAPGGNAVILEEQLIKSGKTVADYNLMSNLLKKQVGMLRTAIGRQQ